MLVSGAPHGPDMWGGRSSSQGPLCSYSALVCVSSFRICLLAGACAFQPPSSFTDDGFNDFVRLLKLLIIFI